MRSALEALLRIVAAIRTVKMTKAHWATGIMVDFVQARSVGWRNGQTHSTISTTPVLQRHVCYSVFQHLFHQMERCAQPQQQFANRIEARSWSEGAHSFKLQYHLTTESLGRGWPLRSENCQKSEFHKLVARYK